MMRRLAHLAFVAARFGVIVLLRCALMALRLMYRVLLWALFRAELARKRSRGAGRKVSRDSQGRYGPNADRALLRSYARTAAGSRRTAALR